MRVALDAQLTVGTPTGIGEYVRGLGEALRREGVDAVELCDPELDPWRFDRRVYWDQVRLPQCARQCRAAVLHCTAGTVPFVLNLPFVVTVHDVAWFRVQSHTRPYARMYFGRFALERYRKAAALVVDSEFSRGELLDVMGSFAPERTHVIYPGVAADFGALDGRASDGRTILAVGTIERRKNLEVLIRALPALPDARIVAIGPPTAYQRECSALAQALGVGERVAFLGYVERATLLAAYATCAVVAVPSRYEGFGYAAAQALAAGVPCVVSDRSSLPEVVGSDAPQVAVDDVAGWVERLSAALRGEGEARARAARAHARERFGWQSAARAMRDVYDAAVGNAAAPRAARG